MGVTWYLANDMQFYLISPLLIYPLWRWGIHGVIWIALVTLASLGINIYVFISGHHNPTIFPLRQEYDQFCFSNLLNQSSKLSVYIFQEGLWNELHA